MFTTSDGYRLSVSLSLVPGTVRFRSLGERKIERPAILTFCCTLPAEHMAMRILYLVSCIACIVWWGKNWEGSQAGVARVCPSRASWESCGTSPFPFFSFLSVSIHYPLCFLFSSFRRPFEYPRHVNSIFVSLCQNGREGCVLISRSKSRSRSEELSRKGGGCVGLR